MGTFVKQNSIWLFILAEVVFFSAFTETFLTWNSMTSVIEQASIIGLIALGMTFVIINGNIDLAVGAILAVAMVVTIEVMRTVGISLDDWYAEREGDPIRNWEVIRDWGAIAAAVPAGLASGALLGALQGFIVWKTSVDSFIVTLAGMLGIRGLVFVYTEENSISEYNWTFIDLSGLTVLGLPFLAIVLLLATALVWVVLTRTNHGRNTYAVGGNREAAVNAGIRVGPHMLVNFMIVGFFAAFAGIALATQSGTADPNAGMLYELWTITAVVLGGTKISGGAGSIIGTLGGVLAIAILRKGMNLMGADSETVNLVIGTILILVLFFDKQLNSRAEGVLKV